MKYQIMDGTVSLGGKTVLSHIDFEIQGTERIALVGKNGAGKTTLLRLLAGEIELDRDDKRRGPGVSVSRSFRVGMLRQQALAGEERTARQVLMDACPEAGAFDPERYAFEREAGLLFRRLGFLEADMEKPVPAFSGGEQTKLALIRLLLEGPDLLLLDEPTNHLDLGAVQWLERYLRDYAGAVVLVSHDRFFLDRTAQLVYELEGGRLTRYHGNYTEYREEKKKRAAIQAKAYERQQEEIRRQERLIERFKHKPSKAAFARSRRKLLERMDQARDIYIIGGRGSAMMAGLFAKMLRYLKFKVHDLISGIGDLFDQAATIGPEDLVIAISLPRYTAQVVEVIKYLHQKEVPVVLITDTGLSPAHPYADLCFHCAMTSSSYFPSYTGCLSLISGICRAAGSTRDRETVQYARHLEKELLNRGIFL